MNPTVTQLRAQWRQRWQALAQRERRAVMGASAIVVLALLWWVGLAPALNTLHRAELRQSELDAQWQQMQTLKAQATALQSQTRLSRNEVVQALEATVRQRLGANAQLLMQGDSATLTLKAVPAEALAQWLTQARINARVLPTEARLVQSTTAPSKSATAAPGTLWDGSLVLSLPAR
jgi:general secretion pathway protein M